MHCKFSQKVALEITTGPLEKHVPVGVVCADEPVKDNPLEIERGRNCIKYGDVKMKIIATPISKLFLKIVQPTSLSKSSVLNQLL